MTNKQEPRLPTQRQAEEGLFLPGQEVGAQAVRPPHASQIGILPASPLQVRLTPPDGCGFYDGLLTLLLQLLTQVQLHLRADGKEGERNVAF